MNYLLSKNSKLNALIEKEIKDATHKIKNHYRFFLKDLVLFGSFSRGEGSADFIDGELLILSDMDFLAILKFYYPKPRAIGKGVDIAAFPFFRVKKPHTFEKAEWSMGKTIFGRNPYKNTPVHITDKDISSIVEMRLKKIVLEFKGLPENKRELIVEKYKWSKYIIPPVDIEMYKEDKYTPSKKGRLNFLEKSKNSRLKKLFRNVFEFWACPVKYERRVYLSSVFDEFFHSIEENSNWVLNNRLETLLEGAKKTIKYKL